MSQQVVQSDVFSTSMCEETSESCVMEWLIVVVYRNSTDPGVFFVPVFLCAN